MKKTELAYIAGLFDGEGCIHISRIKSSKHTHGLRHQLTVDMCMANPFLPELFQFHFGGQYGTKKVPDDHKSQWRWRTSSHIASEFLKTILPYLKIKRDEALLAVEFQERIELHGRGSSRPVTDGEFAVREAQYILLRNLKDKSKV